MQFEASVSDVAGITLRLRSYSQVIHAANVRLPWPGTDVISMQNVGSKTETGVVMVGPISLGSQSSFRSSRLTAFGEVTYRKGTAKLRTKRLAGKLPTDAAIS